MKGRLGKFGFIFLVLALCLSISGAAFAAWTDELTIKGTVNTGDVDVNFVETSSTWVYKILGTHETEVVHAVGCVAPTPPGDSALIASAVAEITGDDEVTVTYTDLFPCVDFKVDFLIHYDGSVPARLNITDPVFTGTNATFFNELVWTLPVGDPRIPPFKSHPSGSYLYGEMWTSNEAGDKLVNIPDLEGYQVHECDYILIVITLHLGNLGEGAPMNAEASFTTAITAIQWNEYVSPV